MTITITVFQDQHATRKSVQTHELEALAELIRNTQRTEKKDLPWLKLADFGERRSPHNSLRHNDNVVAVTGCEADYDGGQMSFDETCARIEKAGLEAIVYTSPSHEPDKPRWRVLAPFSQPLPPHERELQLRRLNGVLGGVVSDESFTLSQAYYYGHLYEAIDFQSVAIRGTRIDRLDELDQIARGPRNKTGGNGQDTSGFSGERLDLERAFELLASGESCHPQVMSILAKYAGEGLSRQALTLMVESFARFHPRYDGRLGEMRRMVEWVCAQEARNHAPADSPPLQPPVRINVAAWENQPVPEQEWTVPNRFPRGEVALLSGPGAAGKSLIALHLCVAHVLGRDWLGAMPDQGPAIFVEAEDRTAVLWRRTAALRQHYGTSFTELHAAGLHLFSLHAQTAVMATASKSGLIAPTPLFDFFRRTALKIRPQLIVLPATANIFAGNENDRSQVSQFIHLLGALADDIGGTVLLITHPSLSGNSRGADHFGLSGSTAWHNGPRARAVLSSTKLEEDPGPDDIRKLEFFKNQYGSPDEAITLRFADGMLKPDNPGTSFEQAAREAAVEAAFMAAFKRLAATGTTIGANRTAHNHPSALFAQEPEIKAAKCSKRDLINAAARLIDKGTVAVAAYGPPSNPHKRLVIP